MTITTTEPADAESCSCTIVAAGTPDEARILDRSCPVHGTTRLRPFPIHGVEIDDAGEFGDESVDVVVHRYVEIDTPENPRLTAAGARALAAALLAAADDLAGDAR